MTVWWRAAELDRRLAAGEDSRGSDELTLRARTLTTARSRTHLADGNGPLYRPGDPEALRSHLRAAAMAIGKPEGAR